jgi:DNA-binding response OmpR family regulator
MLRWDRLGILVVANPNEAARMVRWLAESGLPNVSGGDGSDETLEAFRTNPADVVVLSASLRRGDALAFASAMRDLSTSASLVLIGDERGPIRTALDAIEFQADRFLRRPLAKSTLVFAVRACFELGRSGVVGAVSGQFPVSLHRTLLAATSVAPAPQPTSPGAMASDVARHAFTDKIEAATSQAIDAFLNDSVLEQQIPDLSDMAEVAEVDDDEAAIDSVVLDEDEVDDGRNRTVDEPFRDATPAPPEPAGSWRESTQILGDDKSDGNGHGVSASDEAGAGTFVSHIKRQMDAIEARLFGAEGIAPIAEDTTAGEPPDIDLDAIGAGHVPPPADDVGEIDPGATGATLVPSVRGDIAAEDVAFLIARLAREGFTGRAELRRGDAHKAIFFEDGRPVFATSNLPHDRMGDLLYREGKITREQHARSRDVVAETGRRMGEILVEMGFLKRRELLPAVRRHVEDIIYSLFGWDTGTWSTLPGDSAADEKIRLATHPTALVLEGIRRKMGLERLRARLGPEAAVVAPLRREDLSEALAEADLSPEERQAADLFDGRRTLGEIAAAAHLDETGVYQLAHGLIALGRARLADRGVTATPHAIPTDSGRNTVIAAGSTGERGADTTIDRERIAAKFAHVREADYFTILGVRRDATGFEIRRAWETARRDYGPESFAVDVQRDQAGELREIAGVLDEAYQILRSDELRARYLSHLKD